MVVKKTKIGEATDYGDGTYIIDVNGTTLSDYQEYLSLMEQSGFKKYVDNQIAESLYSTIYTKGDLVVTVTHVVKREKTYIAASNKMQLSEHLLYDAESVSKSVDGAKTKLHMMELYDNGSSFIIQLKNGHFLVNDGGNPEDAPYLFDYLESLVKDGEKPIVEAWIFSHGHTDHIGAFNEVLGDTSYSDRIYVQGVYFNKPSDNTITKFESGPASGIRRMETAVKLYKTTDGNAPKMYRLQGGQKYYFDDIVIDVCLTQEQLLYEEHEADFNDTSTWLMYTIENQKFLLAGDADYGTMRVAMRTYDTDYFDMDIFAVFHHGINVWDAFTDYCTVKTLLYPNYRTGSYYPDSSEHAMKKQNAHLKESAVESLAYGRGTQVLTFPYQIGSAEQLDPIEWIYHPGEREFAQAREENY